MSIKEKEKIQFTFPTENDKLIKQCTVDMQNHDWVLIDTKTEGKDTTIFFERERK